MSLHYHYEIIVDKAIKAAINDIIQLDFNKRIAIANAFKGTRDEVLAIILPDVYGKAVNGDSAANSCNAAAPSVANAPAVDMVCKDGAGLGGGTQTGGAEVQVKKPARPAKKGAK